MTLAAIIVVHVLSQNELTTRDQLTHYPVRVSLPFGASYSQKRHKISDRDSVYKVSMRLLSSGLHGGKALVLKGTPKTGDSLTQLKVFL